MSYQPNSCPPSFRRRGTVVLLAMAFALGNLPVAVAATSVFVVNTVSDVDDGVCDADHCTLREAITAANASVGTLDEVVFAIPPAEQTSDGGQDDGRFVIHIQAPLPEITDPLRIDGLAQVSPHPEAWSHPASGTWPSEDGVTSAWLRIALNFEHDGDGLVVTGGGSTIRGLQLGGADGAAIALASDDNTVTGNHIGIRRYLSENGATFANANGTGVTIASGTTGNTIGGPSIADVNVISHNLRHGIQAFGTSVVIEGNLIGASPDGRFGDGNGSSGMVALDAHGLTVRGNIVVGHDSSSSSGVRISRSEGVRVVGNLIGVTANEGPYGRNVVGIEVTNGEDVVIGGTAEEDRNVIGNNTTGIRINASYGGSDNVRILGNHVGVTTSGRERRSNNVGVFVRASIGVRIGGPTAGERNVISGNGTGISTGDGSFTRAQDVLVQGNWIGPVPGWEDGVSVHQVRGVTPGSGALGWRVVDNVISGNGSVGVSITGHESQVALTGNLIGVAPDGISALANGAGVEVRTVTGATIGGLLPGEGNTIAHNGTGVALVDSSPYADASGVVIRGNAIHSNAAAGIDLGGDGVSPNDDGDVDTGANGLQNFPTVVDASVNGRTAGVRLSLDTSPDVAVEIDVYGNDVCDESGHGEGQRYLGSVSGVSDGEGTLDVRLELAAGVLTAGLPVTATATTADGTSEFSACRPVGAGPTVDPIAPDSTDEEVEWRSIATASDPDGGAQEWSVAGAPAGLVIDAATGEMSWTPTEADGPGQVTFDVCVTDGALVDCEPIELTVLEVDILPEVTTYGLFWVFEGRTVGLYGTATDPDSGPLSYAWDLDEDGVFETSGQSATFSAVGLDGPSEVVVAFRACDPEGRCTVAHETMEVHNDAPYLVLSYHDPVDEGSDAVFSYEVTDPGGDEITVTVDCDGGTLVGQPVDGSFACHLPDGEHRYWITVSASDGIYERSRARPVTVFDVAPTVTVDGPVSVDDGTTVTYAYTITDPGLDTHLLTADCGELGTLVDAPADGRFDCAFSGVGAGVVSLTATDDEDPGQLGMASIGVTVEQVRPVVTLAGQGTVSEGAALTFLYEVTPSDAVTMISCGVEGELMTSDDDSFQCRFPDGPAWSTVSVTAENAGGSSTESLPVEVRNVAPVVALTGDAEVSEGGIGEYRYSVFDPGEDPLSIMESCGSGSLVSTPVLSAFSCAFGGGPDTVPVQVVVDDGDASVVAGLQVTVENVAPSVTAVLGPVAPVAIGEVVEVSVEILDPGEDVAAVLVDWGDGSSSEGSVQPGGAIASHAYSESGLHTVVVTVSDDVDTVTASFSYVVVYDPSAGFVTGGGSIESPTGAFAADPELTGRADFGFVARYKRGATVPSGATEFVFDTAGMRFESTELEWLVVAGDDRAQFKGVGTVNGENGYGFMLSVVDDGSGGDAADRLRMKIWHEADSQLVYDNQLGEADDEAARTELSGGSIVIHRR